MAKGAYVGVNNKARKIKKGYVGVNGKARKIKKVYIGVGGVARPCWAGGELSYYGNVGNLTTPLMNMSCGSVGAYALYAGGQNASGTANYITHTYNDSLTKAQLSTQTPIAPLLSYNANSINFDEKLFFNYGSTWISYDSSLTLKSDYKSINPYTNFGIATIGDCILLVGGRNNSGSTVATVRAINKSWTLETLDNVSKKGDRGGANNNNYAVFPIDDSSTGNKEVDAYDASLTRTSVSTISYATSIGNNKNNLNNFNNYAIFTNNYVRTYSGNRPFGYSGTLTLTQLPALSTARLSTIPVMLGEYAVFIGEYTSSNNQSTGTMTADGVVDYYNKSFVRVSAPPLSNPRYDMPVACTKNFIIAGPGVESYVKGDGYNMVQEFSAYTIV